MRTFSTGALSFGFDRFSSSTPPSHVCKKIPGTICAVAKATTYCGDLWLPTGPLVQCFAVAPCDGRRRHKRCHHRNHRSGVPQSSIVQPKFGKHQLPASFPVEAADLKAKLTAADGILITCPEYNGFITPLLLNALTWSTRGEGGMYDAFKGKPIAVLSTSPGAMGGLRMQRSFMTMLSDMGAICVPSHCTLGKAMAIFDNEDLTLQDDRSQKKVSTAVGQLLHFARFEANRDKNCELMQSVKGAENAGEYGSVH